MKISENDRINNILPMQNVKPSEKPNDKLSEDDILTPERNYDRYIPGDNDSDSAGIYSMEYDDEGNPIVNYDSPEEKKSDEREPEKSDDDKHEKSESCTANTDKVDAELKRLKKRREQLEQQLMSANDEKKKKMLEKQLAAVQNELNQKDNDSYRRSHAVFS